MEDFKKISSGNWEVYEKEFPLFYIVAARHKTVMDKGTYDISIQAKEESPPHNMDVLLFKNVSLNKVEELDKMFTLLEKK